jgi:glycolate oxidase
MDGKTLVAVDEATGTDHSSKGGALLLMQTDGLGASLEMEVLESIVAQHSSHVAVTADQDEAELLVQARREAIPSISRRGFAYVGDVGVPRKHLATMAEALVAIGEETGVDIYTIAHAGDGNLHPIIVLGEGQVIDSGPAKDALDQMFWTAHRLGGTLTGEHGVGVLKRDWLVPELGEESLRLQREIKRVFDPQGILNPGKAIIATKGGAH